MIEAARQLLHVADKGHRNSKDESIIGLYISHDAGHAPKSLNLAAAPFVPRSGSEEGASCDSLPKAEEPEDEQDALHTGTCEEECAQKVSQDHHADSSSDVGGLTEDMKTIVDSAVDAGAQSLQKRLPNNYVRVSLFRSYQSANLREAAH